jgi:hypothetical protein
LRQLGSRPRLPLPAPAEQMSLSRYKKEPPSRWQICFCRSLLTLVL